MTLAEWFGLAATLDVDGLEFYAGFLEMKNEANWSAIRYRRPNHLAGSGRRRPAWR